MEAGLVALIGLGGLYTIATQKNKENFESNQSSNTLINNYPIEGTEDLARNLNQYVNPNTASDRYFNQEVYKNEVIQNKDVGNNLPTAHYSLTGEQLDVVNFKHSNMKPFSVPNHMVAEHRVRNIMQIMNPHLILCLVLVHNTLKRRNEERCSVPKIMYSGHMEHQI